MELNKTNDSFKNFGVWLAALFLVTLGAQLWVVELYGSPLPFWDQWYEANSLFAPWVRGQLKWADIFASDSDHRIVVTHLLDLSLIWLNGRWEPLLQMTVNVFIHAIFAAGLAFCLWDFFSRKNGWLICFLLMPFFALPYAGENAIWGINSLWYLVNIFALGTIVGLGFGKPGSRRWWFGVAAAVISLFTMASGLLAPLAAGGLIILRAIKQRRMGKQNLASLIVCLLLVGLGAGLSVTAEYNLPLNAHTFGEFTAALARNLAWPFFNAPEMACVIAVPLTVLLVLYLRPNFPAARAAELLLALALWSALQSAVIAYGRANYGEGIPASRYMDVLNIFVIASLFAMLLLGQLWERDRLPKWNGLLCPLIFAGIILFGLCRISQVVVDGLLMPTRLMNLVAEERVQTFMATGDERDLFERPTVRPDPKVTLAVLRDAKLQTILPAACLPPASAHMSDRFTAVSQWLLKYSSAILSCGLVLFIIPCGYGLMRGTVDLARGSPPAIIALLTVLTALGFVWSKRSLQRESVEYDLQQQLVADFKAANNFKRAAIHERKTEELKPIK